MNCQVKFYYKLYVNKHRLSPITLFTNNISLYQYNILQTILLVYFKTDT